MKNFSFLTNYDHNLILFKIITQKYLMRLWFESKDIIIALKVFLNGRKFNQNQSNILFKISIE